MGPSPPFIAGLLFGGPGPPTGCSDVAVGCGGAGVRGRAFTGRHRGSFGAGRWTSPSGAATAGRVASVARVDVLDLRGVAALTHLSYETARTYRKSGRLPAPDVTLGQSPGWYRPTIERWWFGSAAVAEVADPEPLLGVSEVAAWAGTSPNAVRSLLVAGYAPPPDVRLGQAPGWYRSTIREWLATRPGVGWRKGVRGQLPGGRNRVAV